MCYQRRRKWSPWSYNKNAEKKFGSYICIVTDLGFAKLVFAQCFQSSKVTAEIVRMHSIKIKFGGDDIPESSGIPALPSSPEQIERLTRLPAKNNVCVSEPAQKWVTPHWPLQPPPSLPKPTVLLLLCLFCKPITDLQIITEEGRHEKNASM